MPKKTQQELETITLPKNIAEALKKLPQDKLANHIMMEDGLPLSDHEKVENFVKNDPSIKENPHKKLDFVY